MVPPVAQAATDYAEHTGKTAPIKSVDIRASSAGLVGEHALPGGVLVHRSDLLAFSLVTSFAFILGVFFKPVLHGAVIRLRCNRSAVGRG